MSGPRSHIARGEDAGLVPARARDGMRARPLKMHLARALKRARQRTALAQRELAALIGRSRSLVKFWEDEEAENNPTVIDLAFAPRMYALDALAWAAAVHEHQLLPVPALTHGENDAERVIAISTACGNAARASRLLLDPAASAAALEIVERDYERAAKSLLEGVERARRRVRALRGDAG